MDAVDAEWYDIWSGCEHSTIVTWHDWIDAGHNTGNGDDHDRT